MSNRFVFYHEMVEENGKTVKQNNLEIKHTIPIGTLVEIKSEDVDFEWNGMRMYIADYRRDCDGTPLYVLGPKNAEKHDMHGGYSEDSLIIIDQSQKDLAVKHAEKLAEYLGRMLNNAGIKDTREQSKQAIESYRKDFPKEDAE